VVEELLEQQPQTAGQELILYFLQLLRLVVDVEDHLVVQE
jgi:hypothetical protein